jgi:N-acetylglucosamine-6-sulfatase
VIRCAGRALLVLTAPVAFLGLVEPAAAQTPDPPDVVVIVTDDQRWDTLWAMPIVRTELARRGVVFPNAFVVNPVCCPSRASILTGDYSHTTMVYRQAPPFGRSEWFDDSSTIATWLDGAGYTTGLFGKYLDGYQHSALTGVVPPGWDRWVAFVRAAYVDYKLTFDGEVRSFGSSPSDHSTRVLQREAVEFVERAEGPLFLVFAPAAPHAPAIPAPGDETAFEDLADARPPSFDEADVSDMPAWVRELPALGRADEEAIDAFRRDQYRSLLSVDRAVGAILGALERTGRLQNALVVLTSDNGIHHGEHRWTKKETPYEESIRVPLVVRWDSADWPVPARPEHLALNIDLAPTIAEIVGVIPPRPPDGRSLVPVLAGRAEAWREDFLIEHLENTNPVPTFCAVRSATAKYVRYATGEEELYDLVADPFELENLAGEPSSRAELSRLRERLRELCVPPPPGFDRGGTSRMQVALALISLLVVAEAVTSRRAGSRRRRFDGPEASGPGGRLSP